MFTFNFYSRTCIWVCACVHWSMLQLQHTHKPTAFQTCSIEWLTFNHRFLCNYSVKYYVINGVMSHGFHSIQINCVRIICNCVYCDHSWFVYDKQRQCAVIDDVLNRYLSLSPCHYPWRSYHWSARLSFALVGTHCVPCKRRIDRNGKIIHERKFKNHTHTFNGKQQITQCEMEMVKD